MNRKIVLALALTLVGGPTAAQTLLPVPPGRSLTATLDGAKAVARVGAGPRIVEFQFGLKAQGGFRPYAKDEPMAPNRPFVVRARYDAEPPFARTELTLAGKEFGTRQVTVTKIPGDPRVLESAEISFGEARACAEGLTVCETREWLREQR